MPNPSQGNQPWRGSITSPAEFRLVVEGALYDARRFADAYPAIYIYQSVAGVFEGLLNTTADLHRPTDDEKQMFESMVPIVRSQAGEANANLLQRFDAIWAYLLEWPVGRPKPVDENDVEQFDGDNLKPIGGLDEIVVAAHRLISALKKARVAIKDQMKAGSMMARAMQEASRNAEKEMDQLLAAIESWAETGIAPPDHAARPEPVMALPQYLEHYLPDQVAVILQLRRSFQDWRKRAATPGDDVEVSTFEQFVIAIHRSIVDAGELTKLAPNNPALKSLSDTADWLRSPVRGWISDLEIRPDRENPIAQALAEDLDLLPWSQLSGVMNGVRMLSELLVNWTSEAFPFFRKTLYETAIDLRLLQIASASKGLEDVARGVDQLLYRTAGGNIPKPHERREIELGEYYERELLIYTSPALGGFLKRMRGIDAFWRRWKPVVRKNKEADADKRFTPPPVYLTRHDAERTALVAVQSGREPWKIPDAHDENHESGDYDPIAEARGFTVEYFLFLLNGSIRSAEEVPMRFPFTRALGLQLRAVRRAVDRDRVPTPDEQLTIGRGFEALSRIIPGVEERPGQTILKDAWAAHLHFQLMSKTGAKGSPAAPSGMIADVDDFKRALADLISDTACLVVFFPNSDIWVNVYRQLERLSQRANLARELSESEKAAIIHALETLPEPPADLFGNVPAFPAGFVDRAHQINDYSRGRRASSPAAFNELLRAVLAETPDILNGRNWDDDKEPLAAIDRQLRALRRWTAGGRNPSTAEREATRTALAVVEKLHGLDRMTEWAARIQELSTAFCDDLPPGDETPTHTEAKFDSVEIFRQVLDECIRDCRSLSGSGLFHKPVGPEVIWSERAKHLAKIRRMLDQNVVPTRRERAEIRSAIAGIDLSSASPFTTIHDFLLDINGRLGRVDEYYAWLVTAGPFAGKETGSVEEAGVQCVSLGGEMRVAFVRTAGDEPGIHVSRAEKVVTSEHAGEIQVDVMRYLPSTRDLLRLVPLEAGVPSEIRWNAHSDYLAYLIPGATSQVGWSGTRNPGEKGRVNASAFAWATKGSNFIAIDLPSRSIFRINADNGKRKDLVPLPDETPLTIAPQIAVSPGGDSLAFTCGRADGGVDLCLLEFAGAKPVRRVRKSFPLATVVFPFWQRNGGLSCRIDRAGGSDIMSIPYKDGDEEILFTTSISADGSAPAWSNTGKFIAFLNPQSTGQTQLTLFDCDTQELIPMLSPGAVRGRLSFGEETICIEGADAATILWPHISHRRVEVERF